MGKTSIEWTDRSWNPVRGCTRVSEGCRNCYAERMAARFPWGQGFASMTKAGPRWTGKVQLVPHALSEPMGWREAQKAFISTSDPFHESLSFEDVAAVIGAIAAAPRQTIQVLTKRPERALAWFAEYEKDRNKGRYRHPEIIEHAAGHARGLGATQAADRLCGAANAAAGRDRWPLPNLWLGVSVEDQATADARIPLLLDIPAAVRFVSYEPALGPVDFKAFLWAQSTASCRQETRTSLGLSALHQVIVGGESGPGARPFDPAWARSVIAQCGAAGVAVFVKQMGRWILGDHEGFALDRWLVDEGRQIFVPPLLGPSAHARPADAVAFTVGSKGGEPWTWPEDLRLREWPAVRA